jgi:hypothetical protein
VFIMDIYDFFYGSAGKFSFPRTFIFFPSHFYFSIQHDPTGYRAGITLLVPFPPQPDTLSAPSSTNRMEAEQQKQQPQRPRRKGLKRKLEDEASAAVAAAATSAAASAAAASLGSAGADDDNEEEDGSAGTPEICCRHSHAALAREVRAQVDALVRCASSWRHADRAAAKRATHVLAELAKNGNLPFPNLIPAAPVRAPASLLSGSGGPQLNRGGCQRDCGGRCRGGLGVPPRRACCGGANAGGTTTAAV